MPGNGVGDRVHNFFEHENFSQGQHQPQGVDGNWQGLSSNLRIGNQRQASTPLSSNQKNYGFQHPGSAVDALILQGQMVSRGIPFDAVACAAFLDGLFKTGKAGEAETMFHTLGKLDLDPNYITYSALLNGICKVGDMNKAQGVLQEIEDIYSVRNALPYFSMIYGYTKKGMLDDAVNVLRKMEQS